MFKNNTRRDIIKDGYWSFSSCKAWCFSYQADFKTHCEHLKESRKEFTIFQVKISLIFKRDSYELTVYIYRTYVCMPPAQFYNWCEVKTKMWAMNLGKPMAVPKLSEQMAIELGANLLGECIIFIIGAGVLLLEYQRQARKETLKEEMALQERLELQALLNELSFQAERQDTQIRELTRILADIGK